MHRAGVVRVAALAVALGFVSGCGSQENTEPGDFPSFVRDPGDRPVVLFGRRRLAQPGRRSFHHRGRRGLPPLLHRALLPGAGRLLVLLLGPAAAAGVRPRPGLRDHGLRLLVRWRSELGVPAHAGRPEGRRALERRGHRDALRLPRRRPPVRLLLRVRLPTGRRAPASLPARRRHPGPRGPLDPRGAADDGRDLRPSQGAARGGRSRRALRHQQCAGAQRRGEGRPLRALLRQPRSGEARRGHHGPGTGSVRWLCAFSGSTRPSHLSSRPARPSPPAPRRTSPRCGSSTAATTCSRRLRRSTATTTTLITYGVSGDGLHFTAPTTILRRRDGAFDNWGLMAPTVVVEPDAVVLFYTAWEMQEHRCQVTGPDGRMGMPQQDRNGARCLYATLGRAVSRRAVTPERPDAA